METEINRDKERLWSPGMSPARIEALCDGVFSIAMTLLVLEFSIPHLIGPSMAGGPPTDIMDLGMEFYTYALGFLALGIFWTLHHYMFRFIKRADGVMVWLNILFLAIVAMVPFWTSVLNTNRGNYTGIAYYGTYMVVANLVLLVMWEYSTRGYRLVSPDIDERIVSFLKNVILVGSSMVALVVMGSFINTYIRFAFYVPAAFFIISTARGPYKSFFRGRTKQPET